MVAFLELTSAVSQPFVIPSLSPVSQPNSRKNSDAGVDDLNLAIANAALLKAAAPSQSHPRKNSLSLL
ncbi:YPR036W-A [Saccharomyces arboricola H-6]|uniref:YPR036W-A n=1 Tax=Saccharomyces arboricola (strain H-6 / AS 2.3317 / CBS 10644) TaxID=1160507 RepID=J8PVE5_SACAR|nr:YPR036W-A [Saccharomyces arboricola H-6]